MTMESLQSIGSNFGIHPSVLRSITSADINFVLWQRNLSHFLDAWAAGLRWNKTEVLEGELDRESLEQFEEDLFRELRRWRTQEPDLTRWIAEDISLNIKHFMNATKASNVFFRFEPVLDDKCSLFHVDNNFYRMLCTYVGAGTLWIPNDKVDRQFLGMGCNEDIAKDSASIYQASKLDVLILKGERSFANRIGGAVHRSPAFDGKERRLLLKVDYIN